MIRAPAMPRCASIMYRCPRFIGFGITFAEKIILSPGSILYGVSPSALVQAVKRNIERFPADFMFKVTRQELANLKSQSVISSWGGDRKPPYAFTQEGVAMLSSVLRSPQAVRVNIEIMRAFVRLRAAVTEHRDLARRLDELEAKYDREFKAVFDAVRALMTPPAAPRKRIGFRVNGRSA